MADISPCPGMTVYRLRVVIAGISPLIWRRLEVAAGAQPGRACPRCTGARRAGPPEDWDGPWVFLERTHPHLVFGATVRAAEIIGQLLDVGDHHDLTGVGVGREELAALMPLLGL